MIYHYKAYKLLLEDEEDAHTAPFLSVFLEEYVTESEAYVKAVGPLLGNYNEGS